MKLKTEFFIVALVGLALWVIFAVAAWDLLVG